MWKEEYCIGEETIDRQHRELFRMTEEILKEANKRNAMNKNKCFQAIVSLKNYVVEHFSYEEEYQARIRYADRNEHKRIHKSFVTTVLEYEKRMVETDFDYRVIKDFVGILTAGLIYHVAIEDQKMAGRSAADISRPLKQTYTEAIYEAARMVLKTFTGMKDDDFVQTSRPGYGLLDGIHVTIRLLGSSRQAVHFLYDTDFAYDLIQDMTTVCPHETDEFVYSAISEVTNIICGNAVMLLLDQDVVCDISPPAIARQAVFPTNGEGFYLNTVIGDLAARVV
jgi:hemerythrin-like metal-binding protein